MKPTNEQCEALMRKHGLNGTLHLKSDLYSLIREAYRLGQNADVMKTMHKEVKNAETKS